MQDDLPLRHEPENRRFVAELGGREAVLDYAVAEDGVLDYQHTWVPPEFRGRGIAYRLVAFGLEYARTQGFRVIPSCSFVAAVMREGTGYASLRADRLR
jgi:hypothetical protein